MIESPRPGPLSDVPWPTSGDRLAAADPAPPAIDRTPTLTDTGAAPGTTAGDTPPADTKAGALRGLRDEWMAGARSTVRGKPLLAVGAAVALGAVIARLSR